MNAISSELELMLLCCAPAGHSDARSISQLFLQIDYRVFADLTAWHQLRPLVARHLKDCRIEGEWLLDDLTQVSAMNARRSLKLSAQLLAIVSKLQEAGITAVPFKGPALSERLFKNVAMREYVDLDLFVRRPDLKRAKAILDEMGYHDEFQADSTLNDSFLRSECEYILRSADGTVVELHWEVAPKLLAYNLDWPAIWQRLGSTNLFGQIVPAFADEDLMLLLLLHASKHGWSRLKWLVDIAQLSRVGVIDYEQLLRRAKVRGHLRSVLIGMQLAARLLQAQMAASIEEECCRDRLTAKICSELIKQLANRKLPSDSRLLRFRLQSRERRSDRTRVLGRTIFSHNQADYLNGAAAGFDGLHYLTRPLRLARKHMRYGWTNLVEKLTEPN